MDLRIVLQEMGLDVNMTRNVGLQGSLDSIGETS